MEMNDMIERNKREIKEIRDKHDEEMRALTREKVYLYYVIMLPT